MSEVRGQSTNITYLDDAWERDNSYPCDHCGAMIGPENCQCPGCNISLCSSCELRHECDEIN